MPSSYVRLASISTCCWLIAGGAPVAAEEDRTPPTVTWVAPSEGAVIAGTVQLSAKAADASGIRAVRFLVDGQLLGETTSPPFVVEWDTTNTANIRHVLQVRAIDGANNGATAQAIAVKVANFNLSPILSPIGAKSIAVGQLLAFTISATDPNGARDPLTYRVAHLPPWAAFDLKTLEVRGTPEFSDVPADEPSRIYSDVQASVCDPQPLCAAETFSITVMAPRAAPAVARLAHQALKEGEPLTLAILPGGQPKGSLACHGRRLPPWGAFDEATCTFAGTPGVDAATNAAPTTVYKGVTFEVCGEQPPCAKQSMSITVSNVNHPPVWEPAKPYQVNEERRVIVTRSATDPDHDPLKIEVKPLPQGAELTDEGSGRGTLRWTPRADQSGVYQMAWAVTDGAALVLQTVTIEVANSSLAITGQILSSRGQALPPGMAIKVMQGNETVREISPDESGRYIVSGLQPGTYVVRPALSSEQEFSAEATQIRRTPEFDPFKQRVVLQDRDQLGIDFIIYLSAD